MADVTQTLSELLAHQLITHPAIKVGTAVDVLGDLAATIYIYHANIEETANATGVSYLIQINHTSGSTQDWITVHEVITSTSAAALENLTATEPIGEKVLVVAATTGFAALDEVYVEDVNTLADSEWGLVELVVGATSVDLVDGLTVAKDTSDNILSAEKFVRYLDLTGVREVRIVVIHRAATGSNIHFKAEMLRATDFE